MNRHRDPAPRLNLDRPLKMPEMIVRQLTMADAQQLFDAAAEVAFVKGTLGVPGSVDEASSMLAEWERLRGADRGNLFGIFLPDASQILGAMGLRLTGDLVGEGSAWSRSDSASRKTVVAGLREIVRLGHNQMGLMRIWVEVDPMDPFTRRLSAVAGFSREGDVQAADASIRHRYSSIG